MDVIRTPRPVLRGWRREDAPAFYAINQDARVHEFLPGPMSMEQVEAFIAFQHALFARTRACYARLLFRARDRGRAGRLRRPEAP